ncbi:MAG: peptide chain release factor N(5)-glutamine methyltransferase [Eubacteriales bacterium]|nr:peptide chain release factor N(5)-glutamine methyltransferase [Eubacteriales bacterium]MDZ7609933.1 peptide chain release factor N(5)-glutamine methyltransferase [Eubacteriales bacterium]
MVVTHTIRDALLWGRERLQAAGVDTAVLDTRVLLAHALNCDPATLYRRPEYAVLPQVQAQFCGLVESRAQGTPVAYLTGQKEFYGLDFAVDRGVLIPRPETEMLVQRGLELLTAVTAPKVVDVGTGSGALGVTVAKHRPDAEVWATDVSSAALNVAKRNATYHDVLSRIHFSQGDLLTPLPRGVGGTIDLILANLPYIPESEIVLLPREVRAEPSVALNGGVDGLDVYRRLIPSACAYLKPGGHLLMEIGLGQAIPLLNIVHAEGLSGWHEYDLAGRERVIFACRS